MSPIIVVELRRRLPEPKFGFPKPALDDAKRDIGDIAIVMEVGMSSSYSTTNQTNEC